MSRLLLSAFLLASASAEAVMPVRSFDRLITSNGFAAASYSRAAKRIDTFLEHPYRFAQPNNPAVTNLCFTADESRNLAFDTYYGVRTGDATAQTGVWLPELALDEAGYLPGTGIIHTTQHAGTAPGLQVETWNFMPMAIADPVLVQVLRVTNNSAAPVSVAPYALFNFHLGVANGGRSPDSNGENAVWDATRHAFYEWGPRPPHGTMAYVAITPEAHRTVSGGNDSAYSALHNVADLDDNALTPAPTSDVVPAFQWGATMLKPGDSVLIATAALWALDENAAPHVDKVLAWVKQRDPMALVTGEQAAWNSWHTAPPVGLTSDQQNLWRQSAAFLRMAQVREPGRGHGQILASLPPGLGDINAQWNISWVRDMAYATAALARTGHLSEAFDAINFQVGAGPGRRTNEVGKPYRISATRYFGNGDEECDCNANGPNIEFDGFGLFLWSVGEYVRGGGDVAAIKTLWPVISTEVADVLVSLISDDGTIKPDSSIWEVHWNGQQRHFTYTSLAAARGLADAAEVATKLGETEAASRYLAASQRVRDALVHTRTDSTGVLAQSEEQLAAGSKYIDAATVEAVNWGLIDPAKTVASATLAAIQKNLRVASGMGFMRNQDGAWYDSQEWVFVDLRLVPALQAQGDTADAAVLLAWVEGQALANDFHIAELHDPMTGQYEGSIPMIGFGAGAYLLARTGVMPAAAGAYGDRPGEAVDGGSPMVDAGHAADADAGQPPSVVDAGGSTSGGVARSGGCNCGTGESAGLVFGLLALAMRRPKRGA
jgi:GH15 family glucan-1,4-alpha-glucosidase